MRWQELGVGNRELALEGTMGNLNKVLTGLVYLGDTDFNTRYGREEKIRFHVNDQVRTDHQTIRLPLATFLLALFSCRNTTFEQDFSTA